ncbi:MULTISPECIES: branched-chain-amino-acid transaminase [Pseudomonas]|jgi:branched-chain amino acid aminotransferase|uniref:Branched-chain-amino-acid aminotransferase n=1 Tax=Pseudomonas spirodelae TaxID=3101751 RepID=A0ABU5PAB2_9PSED|nr:MULTISPECIES: branched-chain-amino-acid transaminase [unclassified Pseudomonas]MBU0809086.1 branched-chain-amino-acid transaminase [Gammaproteobacteria bacterium]MBU0882173.1 branched-chain-amino-acid transaminase [Gammaproteobacteria bacterium]MBU0903196.1 branched-chain-amino-acid transaminase [Gammaproteobacteria bacterium]MBU1860187.1 branched-chain-amino-acid transaminase [Gammaproteobacteria bacterium]MDD2160013.1 branched-chain-amino-acid transaminase [Pseudomonas sp. MIL19]
MSMADRDGVIWYDGELVPWRNATTHVLTHTLHYGMGVFEGVRAYNTPQGTAIFRLQAHTDRLFDSAHIMGMKIPYSKDEINEATRAAVRENNLESAYIRPMVFYGSEAMGLRASGLKTQVIVAAWSWGAYMGDEALQVGIKVRTSSFTRHHVNISMTRAKANGNYINSMLALQEAVSGGADEAMLLDPEGYVAEGSGENIFLVKNGVIYTPEVTSCLNGITRNTILTLAAEHGIDVVEKRITRDEVYIADEAFFTGTAAEVTPIREVDGRQIGAGRRGPITEKLQTAYFDLVTGKTDAHAEWRTLVK